MSTPSPTPSPIGDPSYELIAVIVTTSLTLLLNLHQSYKMRHWKCESGCVKCDYESESIDDRDRSKSDPV